MNNQGYSKEHIHVIYEMYKNTRALVQTDIKGENFDIKRGIKQGDPLSPTLFNIALEEIYELGGKKDKRQWTILKQPTIRG